MSLEDLRICVERPLPSEESIIQDMGENSHTPVHFQRLQAAFQTSKLWPTSTKEIKIQFVNPAEYSVAGRFYKNPPMPIWTPNEYIFGKKNKQGQDLPVDPLEKELYGSTDLVNIVKKVYMERIQPIIPFKLTFVEGNGDVRISFVRGAGSWSLVGTDCIRAAKDEATLNYGWIDVPTIIHEFGHVLGMIHEHENPRGNPIKWNEDKVYEWAARTQGWNKQTTYTNIIMRYSYDQVNGSDFDPKSVMLYFFPASLTLNNQGTQQNMRLSSLDIIWIGKTYSGGKLSPSAFYKKVYGENINIRVSSDNKSSKFKTISIWIIIAIIIFIAIFIVVVVSRRKR